MYVVEQAAQVQPDDFILVLDTPVYQKAFKSGASVLAADIPLINARLGKPNQLVSLALKGQAEPHEFEDCHPGSFNDETHYPVSLFDLALNSIRHPAQIIRVSRRYAKRCTQQWKETLAGKERR